MDDDYFEDSDDIMYADTIAVSACRGHCAAHILFLDVDGMVFSEASLSSEMALELATVLMRLGRGELPAGMAQRLHA